MSLKQQAVSFKPGAVSSEPLKTLSSGPDFPCYSGPCFSHFCADLWQKGGAHPRQKRWRPMVSSIRPLEMRRVGYHGSQTARLGAAILRGVPVYPTGV